MYVVCAPRNDACEMFFIVLECADHFIARVNQVPSITHIFLESCQGCIFIVGCSKEGILAFGAADGLQNTFEDEASKVI